MTRGQVTSFTLTPDAGMQILGVGGTCGGTRSGNVFTTAPVSADCTVEATFTDINNLIVTPTATVGGTITPSTPQIVARRDAQFFSGSRC